MQWYKITISTTIHAQELVSAILYSMDITQIEVINNIPFTKEEKELMFVDILPEVDEKDESSHIIFYLEDDQDLENITDKINSELDILRESGVEVGGGEIMVEITKTEDWANNWKQHFKPFRVAPDIIIKPTWIDDLSEEKVNDNDIIIEIDPAMAFGTGSHETTRLAIDGIRKHFIAGQNILDLGCGSGILSIIYKKLGADKVTAIDIDKEAVKTAIWNAKNNGIGNGRDYREDITFLAGNVLNPEESKELDKKIGLNEYDIVVANILTDVIIDLCEIVGKYLKPQGYFVSTGILESQVNRVKVALEKNGFTVIEVSTMGDWISISAQKSLS